jgi:hypothetical protein
VFTPGGGYGYNQQGPPRGAPPPPGYGQPPGFAPPPVRGATWPSHEAQYGHQYGQYGGGQYNQPPPPPQQQQYGQYGGGGFQPPQQYGQYGGGQYGQPQQPQFAQPATHKVRPIRVQSEVVIRCIQRPSAGIIGPQWNSVALSGTQRPSEAIKSNQRLAISGHQ